MSGPRGTARRVPGVYRFALRPWWIVSHLFVLVLVVSMVSLGMWQLRRLDEARERNERLVERLAVPAEPVTELVPVEGADVDALADRQVTATGTYRDEGQVLVRGRSLDDAPGSWVLVPFDLDDGRVIVVNRGWIRNDGRYEAVPDEYAVPEGEQTLTGLLQPSQERGSFGPRDPADGVLTDVARIDLDRLAAQIDGDVVPMWFQMTRPEADAPDPSPRPLAPPPVDDEGPHLSYAVQWFIFSSIAGFGYPIILRKVARERAALAAAGDAHDGPGDDVASADDPSPKGASGQVPSVATDEDTGGAEGSRRVEGADR